ncbi:ribonucleases P/MRP protein subunit POP1-domain-containing protein [Dichotomopilus funicola]|uniref:Ribonucleases P/MRP protein subunit POP1-domain-containing protein n=1 Tax=Dichotomopilus funicola TaxID=1934379 RepID=A0AAN6V6D9_9PEZI|nr:ribonucleases P/MRP protein subunit POP1-domain-containing protein [Dichotomopilus funicola]
MDAKRSGPLGKGTESKKRKAPPTGTDAAAKSRPPNNNGRSTATTVTTGTTAPAPTAGRFGAKRVKFQDARNIRTQPADAALEDGKLDLQKFLNAREFEIKALEDSMRKCKSTNASRVFQQVPRALRRRTASHNARRVPKRLRERAKREMLEDNTPTVEARKRRPRTTRARIRAETAKKLGILAEKKKKRLRQKAAAAAAAGGAALTDKGAKILVDTRPARPKIRRDALNEPPKAQSKFRKRQINKTWLPTHLWHAKRATMTEPSKPLWRFAIPLTPTEKCYRPTHRAVGQKGVVVWDASYMSTIGLYGTAEGVERVLKALGLTQESLWGARGQKWRAGVRKWTGLVSKPIGGGGSRRDIGPATIVWNPQAPTRSDDGPTTTETAEAAAAAAAGAPPKKPQRQLLIRTHPSCFLELFEELLKLAKMQTPRLHIEDLRFEIGSIELTGPASTETLMGILQPYHTKSDNKDERHLRVFRSLAGVTNPASLPKDAVLAFSVQDPRLSYPPRRVDSSSGGPAGALLETLANWPLDDGGVEPFDIFCRDRRHEASRLPSQKAINRRKGVNPSGEPLPVTKADPPVPVLLLASRPSTDGQAQGTWTLLAPWKCVMPLWYSMMRLPLSTGGNPRLGGLNEQRQIAFEHSAPWFPADYPATDAGREWELEQRDKRRRDWDRRPKGKRIEWNSLDLGAGRKGEVGDGLACDFAHLFALSPAPAPELSEKTGPTSGPGAPQQPLAATAPTTGGTATGTTAGTTVAAKAALGLIRHVPKPTFTSWLAALPDLGNPPAKCSLITIHLTFITRGVANTCARIYRLPSRKPGAAPPVPTLPLPGVEGVEVFATDPSSLSLSSSTAAPASTKSLPRDLGDQWLRQLPQPKHSGVTRGGQRPQLGRSRVPVPPRMPAGIDMATRKKLLAQSIVATELPYPPPKPGNYNHNHRHQHHHPLCPGEEDLLGFVTSGAFSLSEGRGTAIGSISADRALEAIRDAGARTGKLCVVRNAGESVGWLARWEVV